MGFLTAYSTTTKIHLGDDAVNGYWVEVKDCLSQGDKSEAENTLTVGQYGIQDDNVAVNMDVAGYRQRMVLASVKDWNLDDDEGQRWPIDLEHVQQIPGVEFDKIWKIIDKKNAPAKVEDKRQFPAADVGGDSNGRGRTTKSR